MELHALHEKVAASKGPKLVGTRTQSVKWHDDKSLYTGIYARGGPKVRDKPRVINLDGDLCNRHNSDVNGLKQEGESNRDRSTSVNASMRLGINMFEPRDYDRL